MRKDGRPDTEAKVAEGFAQSLDGGSPGDLESTTMRLPANYKQKLIDAGKRENLKLSDMVRRAMREYIERNGL